MTAHETRAFHSFKALLILLVLSMLTSETAVPMLQSVHGHADVHAQTASCFWENYYSDGTGDNPLSDSPSSFIQFCSPFMHQGAKIVEFGCGNGRDARWFARQNMQYLGLDLSMAAVERCRRRFGAGQIKNCEFMTCDFAGPELLMDRSGGFDLVYSRFTMHSVTDDQEAVAFANAFRSLKPGGLFMVEARSTRDPRCGVGVRVSHNAYIETHYRRFLELDTAIARLEAAGFEVRSACEELRAAMFLSDKAAVVRIIALKPPQAPRVSNSDNVASTGEETVRNEATRLSVSGIENRPLPQRT